VRWLFVQRDSGAAPAEPKLADLAVERRLGLSGLCVDRRCR